MLLLTQRMTRVCGRGAGTSAPSAPGSWEFIDGPWDSPGQRRVLLLYELLSAQLGEGGWSGEEAPRRARPESSLYCSWFNWKGGPRLEYSFTPRFISSPQTCLLTGPGPAPRAASSAGAGFSPAPALRAPFGWRGVQGPSLAQESASGSVPRPRARRVCSWAVLLAFSVQRFYSKFVSHIHTIWYIRRPVFQFTIDFTATVCFPSNSSVIILTRP